MYLSKLIEKITVKGKLFCEQDIEIKGLCMDSRLCQAGDLFICIKGEKTDGHCYAAQAAQNGAIAFVTTEKLSLKAPQILVDDSRETVGLLADKFFGEPSNDLKIIGITGTNGKTTTAYMLKSILQSAQRALRLCDLSGAHPPLQP